jgi:cytoskeletal protein CcmA (bactofilin family)
MSNPYDNVSEKVSVLGPTLVFKGELSAEEDLMLKGRVEGSITHTASLRIGEEGSVKGNITAKYITVDGSVDGDMYGSGSVTVRESAKVTGNIYSPTVSLIEGAKFKGMIDMEYVEAAAQPPRSEAKTSDGGKGEPRTKVAVGNK